MAEDYQIEAAMAAFAAADAETEGEADRDAALRRCWAAVVELCCLSSRQELSPKPSL